MAVPIHPSSYPSFELLQQHLHSADAPEVSACKATSLSRSPIDATMACTCIGQENEVPVEVILQRVGSWLILQQSHESRQCAVDGTV